VIDLDQQVLASTGQIVVAPGSACEVQIINQYRQLYETTYYPFLQTNCKNCHEGKGPGIGAFAYPDVLVSGQNFISRFAKINSNAISAAHANGFTGPQHNTAITSMSAQWAQPLSGYNSCKNGTGLAISTLAKANAAILAAAANPNTWTPIEWNLMTETQDAAVRNQINMSLRIEIRVATIGGVRRGYEFRNLSARLNTGVMTPYRVRNFHIRINNAQMSNVTTYTLLDANINSQTYINLVPGTAAALAVTEPAMPAATDVFALDIGDIRDANGVSFNPGAPTPTPAPPPTPTPPTLPATVTLAQLLSNDPLLGVFRQSCVGCHNANNAMGGLDITNPAQAKLQSNLIDARMNNAANPMPRSGLLGDVPRQIVKIWLQSGAN